MQSNISPLFLELNLILCALKKKLQERCPQLPQYILNFCFRTVNAGKSKWNEDQCRTGTFFVRNSVGSEGVEKVSHLTPTSEEPCNPEENEVMVCKSYKFSAICLHFLCLF